VHATATQEQMAEALRLGKERGARGPHVRHRSLNFKGCQ